MTPRDVSVIIPTLNEAPQIAGAIESARAAGAGEVILSDGGSTDHTQDEAIRLGADKLVRSLPGRGTQLCGGLAVAERDYVLFLHADNRLDPSSLKQIGDVESPKWGAFRQHIDSPKRIYRWIETGNATRVRIRSMAFGDQAIFADRSWLMQHGGVSEIPLMEDVDLSRRLRKLAKPILLPGPVMTSARRWEQNGIVKQTVRNWYVQIRYACGSRPETLTKLYQ